MKHRKVLVMLALSLFLLSAAMPVQAASNATALPPLPEWPIIGPILQWLGVVEPTPVEVVEPAEDLDLPQYPIETLDDLLALQDLEVDERVRVTATDTALTAIVQEAIDGNVEGIHNFKLTFTPGKATIYVEVDPIILENANFDLPVNLKNTIKLEGVVKLSASGCQAVVTVEKLSINKWSIGLKGIAQRWINEELPGVWPSEVCVERIALKSGEIAVVGYRR
ncbi:MAG TPA: hypothetical protein PKZ84_19970 [Anaerolineae bacterium]|mgnify:CR=1 FL=1|nr:hypothetical protein [Anaerolineae bacterium]HQI86827.1 hypothetical protein [Anaerolineae bacterium]